MPHGGKLGADGVGITALHQHAVGPREAARRVDGGLCVQAVINHVGDKARVAAGLVGPAHDAKGHGDAAALFQHARNDGVHRAFARRGLIRVAGGKGEACAAVLEGDAEFFRCDARAKAPEDRIDQADGHTVTVNDGDVDGVFVHRFGQRFGRSHGAFGIDQRGEFGRGGGREHVIQPGGGVGDKAVAGVIGEFCRLGLDMGAHGAEGVHRL